MRVRRLLLTAVALTLFGLPHAVIPAGAQQGTRCTGEFDVTVAPGLSAQGSSGTFTTRGETGTVNCQDSTGAGKSGTEGKYGTKDPDTCASGGEGTGTNSLTYPTASGTKTIKDNFTFTYGELSSKGGVVSGKFQGEKFSGTFQFTPTQGDCFSTPMTKAHVTFDGILRG